jgi:multidrug efflux pump subunit AcrA (membrane-fusion protein)
VLSEVACADDHLQAELSVPQTGMARLQVGQGVKLLFDAFPYQRYGIGQSVIRWISPTADDKIGGAFRVLADIGDEGLAVNGERRALMAGMAGRADVVVGRRSLIGYAFAPIRQLRESLAGAPGRPGR